MLVSQRGLVIEFMQTVWEMVPNKVATDIVLGGRGYIQLTGKDNYRAYSQFRYNSNSILDNPSLVSQPEDAINSALWYWNVNKLNKWADNDDVLSVSRVINLGSAAKKVTPNGYDDRVTKLKKIKSILNIK